MPSLKLRSLVAAGCLAASLAAGPASARAPVDRGPARPALPRPGGASPGKFLDQSPLRDARRVQARRDALDRERRLSAAAAPVSAEVAGLLAETALAGTDRGCFNDPQPVPLPPSEIRNRQSAIRNEVPPGFPA